MRPETLLLALLALLITGCAGSAKPALYRSTASVPIEERPTTGTVLLARREIPWRSNTISERVPFSTSPKPDEEQAEGDTPGLRAARERLRARAILQAGILKKAGALMATDPIPGAEHGRTVAELAEREPNVRKTLEELTERGIRERIVKVDRSLTDFIEGTAELEGLAVVILAAGGGHRVDDADIERRAADTALSKARADLVEQIARHHVKGATNLGTWARSTANNALAYERTLREIRIDSSGPESTPAGKNWVVRLSIPVDRLDALTALSKPRTTDATNKPTSRR